MIVIVSSFPEGSLSDGLHLAGSLGKLNTVDTSFNLNEKYTIWSGLIGGLFLMLGYFGCDQSQVQRSLTAKSVGEGRTSLLMSAFLKIPMESFILLIGILVFVFYQFTRRRSCSTRTRSPRHTPTRSFRRSNGGTRQLMLCVERRPSNFPPANRLTHQTRTSGGQAFNVTRKEAIDYVRASSDKNFNDVNYVFPTFVLENMPMGLIGLIIAAIFAAAMSSIAAELNALATATTIDFYRRLFRSEATDSHYVAVGRISTFVWGFFACIVAIFATNLGSLIEVVKKFGSFFYGSLLGVFVLAFAVRRAHSRGAFFGLLFGIASVWIASLYTSIEFLWFNVIGCLVTVVAGYLISLTVREEAEPATSESQ